MRALRAGILVLNSFQGLTSMTEIIFTSHIHKIFGFLVFWFFFCFFFFFFKGTVSCLLDWRFSHTLSSNKDSLEIELHQAMWFRLIQGKKYEAWSNVVVQKIAYAMNCGKNDISFEHLCGITPSKIWVSSPFLNNYFKLWRFQESHLSIISLEKMHVCIQSLTQFHCLKSRAHYVMEKDLYKA